MSGEGAAPEPIRSERLDIVLPALPLMGAIIAGDRRGAQALAGFALAEDSLPSLRVNEKLGFVPTGQIIDGELIFELHCAPILGHRVG
ncbi:MAG: hypothetical protein NTX16_00710 [Actinobacteria bacterium]|nr:hypothetical protein [Actinomycetota bacterium]